MKATRQLKKQIKFSEYKLEDVEIWGLNDRKFKIPLLKNSMRCKKFQIDNLKIQNQNL